MIFLQVRDNQKIHGGWAQTPLVELTALPQIPWGSGGAL